jgi:hypothetical protein
VRGCVWMCVGVVRWHWGEGPMRVYVAQGVLLRCSNRFCDRGVDHVQPLMSCAPPTCGDLQAVELQLHVVGGVLPGLGHCPLEVADLALQWGSGAGGSMAVCGWVWVGGWVAWRQGNKQEKWATPQAVCSVTCVSSSRQPLQPPVSNHPTQTQPATESTPPPHPHHHVLPFTPPRTSSISTRRSAVAAFSAAAWCCPRTLSSSRCSSRLSSEASLAPWLALTRSASASSTLSVRSCLGSWGRVGSGWWWL